MKDLLQAGPPPNRVKPVPVQVLCRIASIAAASTNKELKAISYMIHIAYFLLLRPGEYTCTKPPTNHFQLKDKSLSCGNANFDTLQTPATALKTATYGKLDFITQKDFVQEEVV